MQKQIECDDVVELEISDIAYGGDGVGRLDGLAVFVPLVAVGERVRVRIISVHKRFARARLEKTLTASPTRTEPPCPWYSTCAGCAYQHIGYEDQCALKSHQVRELFRRIGGFADVPMRPMVRADDPYAYRTRITLHGPGRPAYVGRDPSTRVTVDHCALARPEINDALEQWNAAHPEGLSQEEDLALRLDADGVVWCSDQPAPDYIDEVIGDHRYLTPPRSFFQVNPAMANALIEATRDCARTLSCRTLIDAYCGVGVFALALAGLMERVIGIEADRAALKAARANARRQKKSVTFVEGRVERGIDGLLAACDAKSTCVLLDPPRSGCDASVLKSLKRHRPGELLYISCAPDALARDVKTLVADGYELMSVQPFDMFPQTAHVEVLTHLKFVL